MGGRARAAGQTTEVGAQTRTGRRGRPAPSSLGPPCPLLHPASPAHLPPLAPFALTGGCLSHTRHRPSWAGRAWLTCPFPPTHSVLVAWGTCFQPCLEVRAPSPSRNREVGLPGPGARLHRRPGTKGPFGAAYVLPLIPLLTGKDTALLMEPLPRRPWLCPLPASPTPLPALRSERGAHELRLRPRSLWPHLKSQGWGLLPLDTGNGQHQGRGPRAAPETGMAGP